MYPTTHGHTGATITTISVATLGIEKGLPIGLAGAFISHFLLDYLQEYNYGSLKALIKAQIYSLIVFIACLIALYISKEYIYVVTFILGYLTGNAPDIIDKKIGHLKHAKPKEKRLSCHNGNSRFFRIGSFKLGYPTLIKFDKTDQMQMQFAMTVLIIIVTFYILK